MKGTRIRWVVLLMAVIVLGSAIAAQDNAVNPVTTEPMDGQDGAVSGQGDQIPSLTESVLPSLTRIAFSLIVIVVVIYLTIFLLRKISGNGRGGKKGIAIQVIEQTYLAPKKSVCLLKLADRAVLIGITEASINLLTEIEWESLPQEAIDKVYHAQRGFAGILNEAAGRIFKKHRGAEHETV